MKTLVVIFLSLFSVGIYGQDTLFDPTTWKAPYDLASPKDWGIERFPIPIGFAPTIPYKGVEDIRFAPGWAKVKSEEYWSYVFLWYLDGTVKMNATALDSNMKIYYTGLVAAAGSKIPAEKIIPVTTSFKEIKKNKGDLKTFNGTVKMTDYLSKEPILLNCKVHLRSCKGESKTFVFFELSPQTFTHTVWISLDKFWLDFKCKTN